MGQPGWFPPAPPPGHGDHFYYFHLFALSGAPDVDASVDADGFLAAIDDLVIEQARIVGVYGSD
jgi:phosphatidylethanolamine-binding protein (PEBP) family uncharacterized protein